MHEFPQGLPFLQFFGLEAVEDAIVEGVAMGLGLAAMAAVAELFMCGVRGEAGEAVSPDFFAAAADALASHLAKRPFASLQGPALAAAAGQAVNFPAASLQDLASAEPAKPRARAATAIAIVRNMIVLPFEHRLPWF